jgi:hypothetical protein
MPICPRNLVVRFPRNQGGPTTRNPAFGIWSAEDLPLALGLSGDPDVTQDLLVTVMLLFRVDTDRAERLCSPTAPWVPPYSAAATPAGRSHYLG